MKVGGSPLRVWDAPFDELRAVDIGSYRDPRFSEERVPLLSEVLELARGRVKLNIELKVYGQEERLEARVVEIVERHGMQDDVVFMSLSLPVVRTLKALRPDWRVGLLSSVAVGDITRLDADFFAINARFASRSFVERAQGRGKGVLTWTVNDPAGMSAMMGKGVDGIITDRPGLVQRVWKERQELAPHERFLVQLASRLGSDYEEES
jgi:glycerophosphoryl diester phosphodiesterase